MDDKHNKNLKLVENHLANFNQNLYNLNLKMDFILNKSNPKTFNYQMYHEDSQISKMEEGQ